MYGFFCIHTIQLQFSNTMKPYTYHKYRKKMKQFLIKSQIKLKSNFLLIIVMLAFEIIVSFQRRFSFKNKEIKAIFERILNAEKRTIIKH